MGMQAIRTRAQLLQPFVIQRRESGFKRIGIKRLAISHFVQPHEGARGGAMSPIRPRQRGVAQTLSCFGSKVNAVSKHLASDYGVGGFQHQTGTDDAPPIFVAAAMPQQLGTNVIFYIFVELFLCSQIGDAPGAMEFIGTRTQRVASSNTNPFASSTVISDAETGSSDSSLRTGGTYT